MAESISFTKSGGREQIYAELAPQVEALLADEADPIANLANVAAVLMEAFEFLWVGFYMKKGEQLVLGPFQGPIACTRIGLEQGVCGYAYSNRMTVIVPDVEKFPGHIACSTASRSEIVVPIFDNKGEVYGVLDVDSDKLNDFSDIDEIGLGKIVSSLEKSLSGSSEEAV